MVDRNEVNMKKILEGYIDILAYMIWGIMVLLLLQFVLAWVEGV